MASLGAYKNKRFFALFIFEQQHSDVFRFNKEVIL